MRPHFPAEEDGAWIGFHPPDDEWAVGHLERACNRGAEFLLIPTSSLWWLDHYIGLAEHLRARYSVIVEDAERCVIFDLRDPVARSASVRRAVLKGNGLK